MTYKPEFDKDLRFGEAREDAFINVLLRARVEHKSDRKCCETGNIAVEFEQRCRDGVVRPSGIALTKAERWAVEFDSECWLILPTNVVKAIAREAYDAGQHRWIGDGNNHHNVLVPIERFVVRPTASLEVVEERTAA
jgi:hypothetical protein